MESNAETFTHLDLMQGNLAKGLRVLEAQTKEADRREACPYGDVLDGKRCDLCFDWSCTLCPVPDQEPGPFTHERIEAFHKLLHETEKKYKQESLRDYLRRRVRLGKGMARIQRDAPKSTLRGFLRTSANVVQAAGIVVWLAMKLVAVGNVRVGIAFGRGEKFRKIRKAVRDAINTCKSSRSDQGPPGRERDASCERDRGEAGDGLGSVA